MTRSRSSGNEVLRIVLPLVVLGVGITGFIILVANKQTPAAEQPAEEDPIVETVAVEAYDGDITIAVNGLVVPNQEIDVAAEVAGRITYKAAVCRKGKTVELRSTVESKSDDDVMLRIDSHDYDIALEQLQNQKKQAEASYDEVGEEIRGTTDELALIDQMVQLQQVDLDDKVRSNVLAVADIRREKDELLRAQQSRTKSSMLLSQLNFRKSRLDDQKSHLDIQIKQAEEDVRRTTIYAPTSGIIVDDSVEMGEYVQKGTKLFTIEDTSIREIECRLRKQELMWVLLSQDSQPSDDNHGPKAPAKVVHEIAGVQYLWDAKLEGYASSGVDPKTRMVPCRVIVTKPQSVEVKTVNGAKTTGVSWPLLRDTYVTVNIAVDPNLDLLKVPSKAIHPGRIVWLVRDGKLAKSEIQVVQQLEDTTIVYVPRADIATTDRIVVSPLAFPRVGETVQERDNE